MALSRVSKCKTCGELGCSKHVSKGLTGHDAFAETHVEKAFNLAALKPVKFLGNAKGAAAGAKSFGRGLSGGVGGVKPSGANGRLASAGGAVGGKLRGLGAQAGGQKVGLGLGAAGGAGLSSTFMGPKKPRQS